MGQGPTPQYEITVRDACPDDVGVLMDMVHALARYERSADQVRATEDDLRRSLFGANPQVWALVAETGGPETGAPGTGLAVVGMAVYFLTFSTWTGRHGLYLEDLFVLPQYRGRGAGTALLRGLAGRALQRGCLEVEWAVLDWNTPSIGFYRSLGAVPMDEWTVFRLSGDALGQMAAGPAEAV